MSTTDMVERADPIAAMVKPPWYDEINAQQLAMFKANKARGLTDDQVAYALELARSLNLNPWVNEFYAASDNNGGVLVMVGRDGLLRKAEEFPDYRGYDSGVVYENDEFARVEPDPEARSLRGRAGVVHTQGHPKDRGELVGAWAVAEREGRPPRFFFAPLEEYMPTSERRLRYSPWGTARAVMIEKVPISVTHRTLCNLSGVYLQEELDRTLEANFRNQDEEFAQITALVEAVGLEPDEQVQLMDVIRRANEASPGAFGLANAQMKLTTAEGARRELGYLLEQYPPVTDAEVVA